MRARDTARLVRRTRQAMRMTQLAFARHLGVEENTVWRWEHGRRVSAAYRRLIEMEAARHASAGASTVSDGTP